MYTKHALRDRKRKRETETERGCKRSEISDKQKCCAYWIYKSPSKKVYFVSQELSRKWDGGESSKDSQQ